MKIKFIKPFRFIGNAPDDGSDGTVPVGYIVDLENDESTQWLINNGFAEEVKEPSGWKPEYNKRYFHVGHDGLVHSCLWINDPLDNGRLELGFVFKTRESAQRFINYLKAVETVRHDEGFMKISRKIDFTPYGYGIYQSHFKKDLIYEYEDSSIKAGEFYFDTSEHAQASLEAHRPEWKTILNYDWSKGEEEEDD